MKRKPIYQNNQMKGSAFSPISNTSKIVIILFIMRYNIQSSVIFDNETREYAYDFFMFYQ